MNIYVKSRGVSKGYSWVNQNDEIDNPPLFAEGIKIVDTDDFSLVLYRLEGQLSLLITGLETKDRTDNRTRRIRNSVLWVGGDSDEETLRKIAIKALEVKLANEVDQAVVDSKDNDKGFTVTFFSLQPQNLVNSKNLDRYTDDCHKIGNLSAFKEELISHLEKYSLPKQKEGMLVVVSSTVSQSNLEQNQVWRGLSDTISDDEWIDRPVMGDKPDNFRPKPSDSNPVPNIPSESQKSQSGTASTFASGLPTPAPASSTSDQRNSGNYTIKKWMPIIIAFVIGLVIGIVGHYLYYTNIPNRQREQIQQNEARILLQNQTISQQKQTIAEQKNTIAQKAETIKDEDQLIKESLDYLNELSTKGSPLIKRANELINESQK
ncbi:hypothetical protein [Laspinema olomoucense]|uniref:hypothetical protein n=1 Tax=Laspinema olomoucense TaxID=3231600 RepID=UPI0021BAAE2F|nr:hypothetical protein [Laspinema sp. D3d]MCT7974307.1 hypothetical protein [Laspinema sp. D3d]